MFLDYAATCGLLQHNSGTNVLKDFSPAVKKVLVSQVVFFLKDAPVNILSSENHVRWTMETLGQGFTLPIEEEATIAAVTDTYRKWALEPFNRPPVVEENLQFFLQTILSHYSLLFQPRGGPTAIEKQAQLCSKVLDIYLDIGRQMWKTLSMETWELFLKLLLGITACLLTPNTNEDSLGKRLCSQLLSVLFELWLFSRTRNPAMWNQFKGLAPGWFHHDRLIEQWNMTMLALTQKSLQLSYPSFETSAAQMYQHIKLENDFVDYAWYRTLHVIGNPNKLNNPQIFLHAWQGIENLVKQYLKTGDKDKKIRFADGNTILHIFGHWMFESIELDRSGFDEGTALAVKILCNIFCARPYCKYLPIYLGSFCYCLHEVLQKEGRVLISAIMHCQQLFDYEIQGLRVLVPAFIHATGRILQRKISSFDHIERGEVVRKACMNILGTLFCLPNHFGSATFKIKPSGNIKQTPLAAENYLQLKTHLNQILIDALKNETYPPNIQLILNHVFAYACEDINNSSVFTKESLAMIISKITTSSWNTEVSITGLRILTLFTLLYPSLEHADPQANFVCKKLCEYIIEQCNKVDGAEKDSAEALVPEAFTTVTSWVLLPTQWILQDRDLITLFFRSIVTAIAGKEVIVEKKARKGKEDKTKKELYISEKIQESAEFTLQNVMNYFGNFPPASGPSRVSTLVTEEELIAEMTAREPSANPACDLLDGRQILKYYFVGTGMIIGILDRPYEEGGPGVTVIVRDRTGKYSWDSRLSFLPLAHQGLGPMHPIDENDRRISTDPFVTSISEVDPSTLADLYAFFDKKKPTPVVTYTPKQVESEVKLLKTKQYGLHSDIAIAPNPPASIYGGDLKFQQSRLFMSHLGFLSFDMRERVFLVEQNANFYKRLQMLDKAHFERENQQIGVMYVAKGQNEAEAIQNLGGSLDYQEFLSTIGWGISTNSHNGFLGSFEKTTNDVAPYYANWSLEVIFLVSTLIPNTNEEAKKRLINTKCYVMIVWCQDLESYQPDYKSNMFINVHLVIHPLNCGLYRIKIFQRNEQFFGPLIDEMVVSKNILGLLIRETAIQATRTTNPPISMQKKRDLAIKDLIKTYRKDPYAPNKKDPTVEIASYGSFCCLPPGESGPPIPPNVLQELKARKATSSLVIRPSPAIPTSNTFKAISPSVSAGPRASGALLAKSRGREKPQEESEPTPSPPTSASSSSSSSTVSPIGIATSSSTPVLAQPNVPPSPSSASSSSGASASRPEIPDRTLKPNARRPVVPARPK